MSSVTYGDFYRITRYGPAGLEEHLWFYLHREGLEGVKLSWHSKALFQDIGLPCVWLISRVCDWLMSHIASNNDERPDH